MPSPAGVPMRLTRRSTSPLKLSAINLFHPNLPSLFLPLLCSSTPSKPPLASHIPNYFSTSFPTLSSPSLLPSPSHPAILHHAFSIPLLPTDHLDALKQLDHSLNRSHNSQPPPLSLPELAHLHARQLFQYLSPSAFRALLAIRPPPPPRHASHLAHQLALHKRILFLLDRVYELEHRFEPGELDSLHTLALRQYASVGFWRGAELLWDHLIRMPASTRDQLHLLQCIRNALVRDHWARPSPTPSSPAYPAPTPSELRRMLRLAEELGTQLVAAPDAQTHLVVRAVAEILASQCQKDALGRWLKLHCAIDLDLPDAGASWSDPTITAAVVAMYRQEGLLGRMVAAYHVAAEPSPRMLAEQTHAQTGHPDEHAKQPHGRPTNVILTRTFHDLIEASCAANRPHLAIYFLAEAVGRTEAYVAGLPAPDGYPPVPPLRLQPATFVGLVQMLRRRRRSTQLETVSGLAQRLLDATVGELEWIRQFALSQLSGSEGDRWEELLGRIIPRGEADEEERRRANRALERRVFSRPWSATDIGFERLQERTVFLSRTLAHTVRLLTELPGLVGRAKISRAVRWEIDVLKRKQNRSTGRVEKLIENLEVGQRLRGGFMGNHQLRKKVLKR